MNARHLNSLLARLMNPGDEATYPELPLMGYLLISREDPLHLTILSARDGRARGPRR